LRGSVINISTFLNNFQKVAILKNMYQYLFTFIIYPSALCFSLVPIRHQLWPMSCCILISIYCPGIISYDVCQGTPTFSITTLSITTLSIKGIFVTFSMNGLFVTFSIKDTQHNKSAIMLSIPIYLLLCWISLRWVPLCWMSWRQSYLLCKATCLTCKYHDRPEVANTLA